MDLTAATTLLKTALALLVLVQSSTSLPASIHDYAITVASNAIAQATASLNAHSTTPTTAPSTASTAVNPIINVPTTLPSTPPVQSPSNNITVAVSAVPLGQSITGNTPTNLGGFSVSVTGEPITVKALTFKVAFSGATSDTLTQASLVANSDRITGFVDEAGGAISFSNVTFPVGTHTYTINGIANAHNGDNITLMSTPSSDWQNAVSQITGRPIQMPATPISLTTSGIRAYALSISLAPLSPPASVAAGTDHATLAYIKLDASQSAGVLGAASLPLTLSGTAAASLTNCQLWQENTSLNVGSDILYGVSPGRVVFNKSGGTISITGGSSITLTVKCNVGSSALPGSTVVWGLNEDYNHLFYDLSSGMSVAPTVQVASGQTITITAP